MSLLLLLKYNVAIMLAKMILLDLMTNTEGEKMKVVIELNDVIGKVYTHDLYGNE